MLRTALLVLALIALVVASCVDKCSETNIAGTVEWDKCLNLHCKTLPQRILSLKSYCMKECYSGADSYLGCKRTCSDASEILSENEFTEKLKRLANEAIEEGKRVWRNLDKCNFCKRGCDLLSLAKPSITKECGMACEIVCAAVKK
ncbi:hypothetical protein AKO1_014804 [Acrasis kona]|uniref:Uncharacterized protein n=1 Tax=Acrasis kona TaxID=1008807 RepID=A0AAW2YTP8_9EUKA